MQRGFIGSLGRLVGVLTVTALVLLARAPIVEAISDAEQSFLAMYFTEEELHVVSATRSLQSIERIAENIEVVTAADIELMNAHTLADVLSTVPGVQASFPNVFGARANVAIQGAGGSRVTILMNGVPLAFVGENFADAGFIPVHDIEKIEVVKGPASSAWGSALGGVVNIITKRPGGEPFQGTASVSYGAENSTDYHAAVSGRAGRFGYYLSGTGLRTDGVSEGFDNDAGHFGTNLNYAIGERTAASFNLFYGEASRGDGLSLSDDLAFRVGSKRLVSDLTLASAIGREGHLVLSLWTIRFDEKVRVEQISDGTELALGTTKDNRSGAGLRYTWSHGPHGLVVGSDYSAGKTRSSDIPGREPSLSQWALYANDTISLGPWTIAPGIRFDSISTSDGFWSPSLGATYALTRDLLARATVARGFNAPPLNGTSAASDIIMHLANPELTAEKVWSYQLGLESNVADLCWLKVSAFRHDIEDAFSLETLTDPPDWWRNVNAGRERRQGVEAEVKTKPFHHFTLAGNAFFMKTEDLETGEEIADVPKRIYDLSLKYDEARSFRGLLRGRYYQQDEPPEFNANLDGFIFDLNLAKSFTLGSRASIEAFLAVHNLFNGAQYWVDIFKNPDRWVEGGVRVSF